MGALLEALQPEGLRRWWPHEAIDALPSPRLRKRQRDQFYDEYDSSL